MHGNLVHTAAARRKQGQRWLERQPREHICTERARQHERHADAEDMPQLRDIFLAEFVADNRCNAH